MSSIKSACRKVIYLFTALLLPGLLAGCGGGLEKFPTAAVTGTVLCEGKPVESAIVYFEPLREGSSPGGKQGWALTDADGKFTISTYGDQDGAVIGKHRVRVGPPANSSWQCDCVTEEEKDVMQVDVVDGENDFEVVLPKKPRGYRQRGVLGDEDEEEDD